MTISYTFDIASTSPLNIFRLLLRWRASVWKSVSLELAIWTTAYVVISFIYRSNYFLTEQQKRTFEDLSRYCDKGVNMIPLTFILGFFVNLVVQRWTDAFKNMGYLESQAIHISSMVIGLDNETRLMRRTLVRYLCLAQVLVFRDISVQVRKRFPTLDSIVKAGFMMQHEKEKLEAYRIDEYDKFWVPINWAFAIVVRARKMEKIIGDTFATKICDEIKSFRSNLEMLCNYDWVEIPLVYPQVVFMAVHVYFCVCLIGRQYVERVSAANLVDMDFVLPFMTMLQFTFYVGWMKVAEGLLNPFGEDDDDFECNFLIDKNFATCLCIADEAHDDVPELKRDRWWSQPDYTPLYASDAVSLPNNPLVGSATRVVTPKSDEETEMVERRYESNTKEVQRAKTTLPLDRGKNVLRNRLSTGNARTDGTRIDRMTASGPTEAVFREDVEKPDQSMANVKKNSIIDRVGDEMTLNEKHVEKE
ncbi:hypothetical protein AB6A40_002550 [Gnathostoma spinigerum]|uniref:Bestrophin homolog n=1 Tax=Gnathostoma spinigerum TaxID=75299 RepID=A0ABD6E9G5_9BILA